VIGVRFERVTYGYGLNRSPLDGPVPGSRRNSGFEDGTGRSVAGDARSPAGATVLSCTKWVIYGRCFPIRASQSSNSDALYLGSDPIIIGSTVNQCGNPCRLLYRSFLIVPGFRRSRSAISASQM
jgi:hypothetical protein